MSCCKLFWRCQVTQSPLELDNSEIFSCLTRVFHYDTFLVCNTVVLIAVSMSLVSYLCHQLYYISHNVLQIELDKFDREQRRRRKRGITSPVTNSYDRGFVENWKEFLSNAGVASF